MRSAVRFAPLLFVLAACDSGEGGGDGRPTPGTDDGSVALADVYLADVSGTSASFFRPTTNAGGTCTPGTVTLRFDTERFDLACTIVGEDGENEVYNPDGPFEYALVEGELTIFSSFDYSLTGTATADGSRIEATIQRGNGPTIQATLVAQE